MSDTQVTRAVSPPFAALGAADTADYPERLVQRMQGLASLIENSRTENARAVTASLYGLVLDAAYALAAAYHRLAVTKTQFYDSPRYFFEIRLKLHHSLIDVAKKATTDAFATELVGLNINSAQHFTHFLLDRLLNDLIQRVFDRHEQEMGMVFYNFVGMRVSVLRWRLAAEGNDEIRRLFEEIDKAFTKWGKSYQAGNCNGFVEDLVSNPEVEPCGNLAAVEHAVRLTLGSKAGGTFGALAYIVDRTNEAKHLPNGAGRTQLARHLREAALVRRLYEVEWAVTFVAFERMVDLLSACIRHLDTKATGSALARL